MLKSHIRTIDRFRDIEQTLIFGYLKFIFLITIRSCDLTNDQINKTSQLIR